MMEWYGKTVMINENVKEISTKKCLRCDIDLQDNASIGIGKMHDVNLRLYCFECGIKTFKEENKFMDKNMKEKCWKVNTYEQSYMNNLKDRLKILERKYYEGFKVGRDKNMFEEELKDVKDAYETCLKGYNEELESMLPMFMAYMEKYIYVQKMKTEVQTKLSNLEYKMDKQKKEAQENDDE